MPLPLVPNRKPRRTADKASRRTRAAALAGVALTATALTATVAPPTTPKAVRNFDVALAADPIAYPTFGVGPVADLLVNLANLTGYNPIPVPLPFGEPFALDLQGGAATARGVYNLINNLDYTPLADIPRGAACGKAETDACRTAYVISTDIGSLGTTEAIRALIDGASGNALPLTYDALKPFAGGTGMTNVSSIYINSLLRPDGGLASRFPDITKAFGINPLTPPAGETGPNADGSRVYNWTTDITWPYNPVADLPVTANPLALANSLMATFPPPSLIKLAMGDGEVSAKLVDVLKTAVGTYQYSLPDGTLAPAFNPPYNQCGQVGCDSLYLLGLLGALPILTASMPAQASALYITLDANKPTLPITYPLYITSTLVNTVLKAVKSPYLLGTPAADVLSPALKILINSAYTDVIAPDEWTTPAQNYAGPPERTYQQLLYTPYDRTFTQAKAGEVTPFAWFNNPGLTPEQAAKVPGDTWTAFTDALKAQLEKPMWGILVPNPDIPTTPMTAAVSAPAQAVSVQAAAADATSVEAAPVSDPAAPVESAPAPVAEPAPAIKDVVPPADAPADDSPAAPATPSHRGHAAATTGISDGHGVGDNGGSTGHRGARG